MHLRQVLRASALGRPRGMGWRGRWERGSGWGTHVDPWLIHVNVWQKPLQYHKVINLQLIETNGKKKILCINWCITWVKPESAMATKSFQWIKCCWRIRQSRRIKAFTPPPHTEHLQIIKGKGRHGRYHLIQTEHHSSWDSLIVSVSGHNELWTPQHCRDGILANSASSKSNSDRGGEPTNPNCKTFNRTTGPHSF